MITIPQTLVIKDWLAIIGISSLVATALAHWLSRSREYERWAYENRKQEWRELIDQMNVILYRMRLYHSRTRNDILEDLNEGMRLLNSRLFIGETLNGQHLADKWSKLIGDLFEESQKVTEVEFLDKTMHFERELISVAQHDLRFKRAPMKLSWYFWARQHKKETVNADKA